MLFREDAAFHINRTSHALRRAAENRLRGTGIGVGQLPALVAIADHGPLTQAEIAQRLRVEQPTAAALLKRMAVAGLIEKKPVARDRRASHISLTAQAESALPQALAMLAEINEVAMSGLSDSEIDLLTGLLGRVLAKLDDRHRAADGTDAAR